MCQNTKSPFPASPSAPTPCPQTCKMLERSGWVPKVPQLTGRDVIDEKCGGTKICVIAAVPHILESGKAGRCVRTLTTILPICGRYRTWHDSNDPEVPIREATKHKSSSRLALQRARALARFAEGVPECEFSWKLIQGVQLVCCTRTCVEQTPASRAAIRMVFETCSCRRADDRCPLLHKDGLNSEAAR